MVEFGEERGWGKVGENVGTIVSVWYKVMVDGWLTVTMDLVGQMTSFHALGLYGPIAEASTFGLVTGSIPS